MKSKKLFDELELLVNPNIDDVSVKEKIINGEIFYHYNDEIFTGICQSFINKTIRCYKNGKFHRLNGPAIIYYDYKCCWCYNGKEIKCSSQEEFEKIIKLLIFE